MCTYFSDCTLCSSLPPPHTPPQAPAITFHLKFSKVTFVSCIFTFNLIVFPEISQLMHDFEFVYSDFRKSKTFFYPMCHFMQLIDQVYWRHEYPLGFVSGIKLIEFEQLNSFSTFCSPLIVDWKHPKIWLPSAGCYWVFIRVVCFCYVSNQTKIQTHTYTHFFMYFSILTIKLKHDMANFGKFPYIVTRSCNICCLNSFSKSPVTQHKGCALNSNFI